MVAAAIILESKGGLRGRQVLGLLQGDLGYAHSLSQRVSVLEAAYACGILNSWKTEAVVGIETIAVMSQMTDASVKDAIGAITKAVETWGASNYLVLKLCFIKEFFELDHDDELAVDRIDAELGHPQSPFLQYFAMEQLKDRLSLFSVARRHTNTLMESVDGDFRRFHSLNNLVATPFSEEDCAGFLLRAAESSLLDVVRSVWMIVNLRERLPGVYRAIERNLDPDIFEGLMSAQAYVAGRPVPDILASDLRKEGADEDALMNDDRSLTLYRRSVAFLEFPALCMFRHDIDQVVGYRLIAPVIPRIQKWHADDFSNLPKLRQPDGVFELSGHNTDDVQLDTFYRTYFFLRFIQNALNVALISSDDIQYIFEHTVRLETLLLERELTTMHVNASDEARALINVFALALYRGKSSDPDIDFDFRANLEDHIIKNFSGRIPDFIESIAAKSPEVANYIAACLDEVTLQKMYQIIGSPLAAESARKDILTSVGIHLNKIEYIIEAEAIETRSKVAKLKNYFDASRMYVDSIAMTKWLSSNPSTYTEQYKELLPKITARIAMSKIGAGKEARIDVLEIASTDEFLVERMATDAFREFCVNNEFGIESYLGRRIRHNTLQGVMTKSVDAVLLRSDYQPIIAGTPFGDALRAWEIAYKVYIERMRKEFLQFKVDSRPQALFVSQIDPAEPVTKRNLQQLVQTLRVSGAELLDDLIISFCWRQIGPQLDAAARQIRVKMTQDVTQSLDHALHKFNNPEEMRIKHSLQEAITSVFSQVASWFQIPQTGFVPASIPDICNIIDIEFNRAAPTTVCGNNQNTKYYGISVHRLYDCLAVLLQNAFKHGRPGTDVVVNMLTVPIEQTNIHELSVAVRSALPARGRDECVQRLGQALGSSESARDMVTEGYSGIKKVKFITRLNEGDSTVDFEIIEDDIEVRFRLRVEVEDRGIED